MTIDEVNKFSTNLFWDANTANMNMERNSAFIVGRVLDYGQWNDWLFIRKYYVIERIKEIASE